MNLLYVVDGLDETTLSEPGLWLSTLARREVGRGHRVEVLSTRPPLATEEPVSLPGALLSYPDPGEFERALGEALARAPDVVHVAGAAPFGARAIEALDGLPLVVDAHDFWPICPQRDLLRRPRQESCGEHYPYRGCGACAGIARLREAEDRLPLLRAARAVVAHSSFGRVRLNAGLSRPIEMIGYGVDTSHFRPDPPAPLTVAAAEMLRDRGRPRAIWMGPPTLARGADHLLDLLVALHSRLPEVELVVAGRDPSNPDAGEVLQIEARGLGLEKNLRLMPRLALTELPAVVASAGVAVAPVPGPDPGGLFLLQALACGVPIVTAPLGAAQEIVRDVAHGYLAPPNDIAAFASAAVRILLEPERRAAMSARARAEAVERHDFSRTLDELDGLYARMVAGSDARRTA